MDIHFTTTSPNSTEILKQITSNPQQIKLLQDYCRAFYCIKTKGTGTVTVWVN